MLLSTEMSRLHNDSGISLASVYGSLAQADAGLYNFVQGLVGERAMRLILTIAFVMIALLSPVSAQELPAPPFLAFDVNINSTQAIVTWDTVPGVTDYLYVIRPTPRCDSGATLVAAAGDLWSRVGLFNPRIPYTVTVTSMVNDVAHGSATVTWTPPQTLSNVLIPDFRVPTAVSWLSAGLWETGTRIVAGEALHLPPGQAQDTAAASLDDVISDQRQQDPLVRSLRDEAALKFGVDLLRGSANPAYYLSPSTDSRAGIDKLWNCANAGAPQPGAGTTTTTTTTTTPGSTSPSVGFPGEVHELATNLGGLGGIYRASYNSAAALVVYRYVSASQGEIAFWVTQAEFAAAGTGCVKASADGRIAATKQDNGNAVIAMGPDGENKTFHAIFNGGLSGGVGGISTTYDGAPGAGC